MFPIIIKGIIAGFSLAAPGEAIGFLCLKETEQNILIGITTGLAAASADFLYGVLAIIIFQIAHSFFVSSHIIFTIIAGLFLCGFGLKRFFDTPSLESIQPIKGNVRKIFITTFLFTLTNSSTILEFISLFIGFDITINHNHELLFFVAGVFLGSLLWWICIIILDELYAQKTSITILRFLNYISALIIFAFGVYTLI